MKNKSAIRSLLTANFISGIAQGITMITIPMYFAKENMGNFFTFFYLIATFIGLFWSLYAGTLVDKYNRQFIFWTFNLGCAIILALLSIIAILNGGVNSIIAMAAFLMTFFYFSVHFTSFYAFMQEISEPNSYNKIASTIEIQVQLASALAGALAAILWEGGIWFGFNVPKIDLAYILAFNSFTYFIAFLFLKNMKYEVIAQRKIEIGNLLIRLKTGYNWLKDNILIAWFGILSLTVFVLVMVGTYSLNTVYCNNVIKSGQHVYAISEMFFAVGAMFAGAFMQYIFKNFNTINVIIFLIILTIFKCIILTIFYQEWVFYACCFVLGLSNAGIRVLRVPFMFKLVPNQVQGRVNSLLGITNTIMRLFFLSLFSISFFHQNDNIKYVFVVFALFFSISVLSLLFIKNKLATVQF